MFQATTAAGDTLELRASFWQCVKAGAGFFVGGALTSVLIFPIGLVTYLLFYGAFGVLFRAR